MDIVFWRITRRFDLHVFNFINKKVCINDSKLTHTLVIKEKNKQKTKLIKAQQEEIKNLKDSILVFEKFQLKYMEASNKIKELNTIIAKVKI